ncbi:MAG: CPBP family glutamic-type intramembrane protease [Candidatus Loosdrechtia sp.]|uniref:CPBP family glutamic-type intramembrane protease n=1 Tax=Candidatus Loosdrechtia sp. TaxID=3101272 RepID=UPI003A7A31F0|nr:MAG: CPBP family glutamic-type intramembrane protease [Candidatus Jettenia sp. AMX2]
MSYFPHSRNLANSFLFILPLLVFYEFGIAFLGSNIKNAADVIIKTPLILFGRNGSLVFNLVVIISLIVSLFYIEKEYKLSILIFIPMFIESVLYALFIGHILGFIVYRILSSYLLSLPFLLNFPNLLMQITLSVGAGVYEEIVFRLILITSLSYLLAMFLKIPRPASTVISVLLASLIFVFMHYVGTFGDTFTYTNFTFRLLAGIVLSVIFIFRGLGIAVYTHAIYNVFLVLRPFHI